MWIPERWKKMVGLTGLVLFLMLTATGCPAIVGDSVTNQSRAAFGGGWSVNAVDGRFLRGSEATVASSSGGATTVIALGSNDVKTVPRRTMLEFLNDIKSVQAAARPGTCLLWVDVSSRGSTAFYPNWPTQSATFNAVLPVVVGGEGRVLRWSTHSAGHPEWFVLDGLHLTDAGEVAYANFVKDQAAARCP